MQFLWVFWQFSLHLVLQYILQMYLPRQEVCVHYMVNGEVGDLGQPVEVTARGQNIEIVPIQLLGMEESTVWGLVK